MTSDSAAQITPKAEESGAALTGIANVERVQKSPSRKVLNEFGTQSDGYQWVNFPRIARRNP